MLSPTLELIRRGSTIAAVRERPMSELEKLKAENQSLKKKLAMLTAQYVWAEGGSYSKIDQEIHQYGFRLEKMDNGYDPRIVPIGEG